VLAKLRLKPFMRHAAPTTDEKAVECRGRAE
jgi:hypothetical protein